MAYVKEVWVDRNVQFPNRYTDELAAVKTFTVNAGTITEAGTSITAAKMNNIETGLEKTTVSSDLYSYKNMGGSL